MQSCYFCDDVRYHKDGFYVCVCCSFVLPIQEYEWGECGICCEDSTLLILPCEHKLCLQCCKTIYFGIATTERPVHRKELGFGPSWPNFDDDRKYEAFRERGKSRPDWMNTEEFLTYETALLKHESECEIAEKEWQKYQDNKFKGNGTCPFCVK